jgi:glycosyltransferase involved in cell wall biosynthesis
VPVVSTDCPLGPAEIIDSGRDGLLVPRGDGQALAGALLELIEAPERRREMAGAARRSAHRYDPEPIAERYHLLFEDLRSTRTGRAWQRTLGRARNRARRLLRRALRR